MKKIFENETIKISTTGRDYDFVAVIENKTKNDIGITLDGEETIFALIGGNDWVGLINTEFDCSREKLLAGQFEITKERQGVL